MGVMQRKSKALKRELRLVLKNGRRIWRLVPRRHKLAFGGTTLVMVVTSATYTALPVLLGTLTDVVQRGLADGVAQGVIYRAALVYLGLIAGVYFLREALNVLR